MHPYLSTAVCAVSLPALQAATAEGVCRDLSSALQQEAEVLARVRDPATAQTAAAPLREVLAKLAALKGQVDDNTLWNYIDSTVDVKPGLLLRLRNVALEFARLEKANFYGNKDIASLLAPQLNRNEERSAAK